MPFITPVKRDDRNVPVKIATGTPASIGESIMQNIETAWMTGLQISEFANRRSLISDMQNHYREVTGEEIESPFKREVSSGFAGAMPDIEERERIEEFYRQYNQVVDEAPRAELSQINSPEDFANQITSRLQASEQRLAEVKSRETSIWNTIAGFGASMGTHFLADPINLMSLAVAAPAGASYRAVAATEAAINIATEIPIQAQVQKYRAEHGLHHGTDVAMQNIGFAGLGGAVFGPAAKAGFEGAGRIIDRLTPNRFDAPGPVDAKTQAAITMQEDLNRVLSRSPFEGDSPFDLKMPRGERQHIENMMKAEQDVRTGRTPDINENVQPPTRNTDDMADVDIPGTRASREVSMRDVELDTERFPMRVGELGEERVVEEEIPDRLLRIEEGEEVSSVDKPQGLYISRADVPSPHEFLGGQRGVFAPNREANILRIRTEGLVEGPRGFAGESAGLAAVRRLVDEERANRLFDMNESELIEEFSNEFPDVNWGRFEDAQEILEGYAGMKARNEGFDAIWATDPDDARFDEFVALTERALEEPSQPVQVGRQDPFVLFEREDGTMNPVDELGKRSASLARQTDEDVTGSAFIFREADGWGVDEVNRIGIMKDFREGRLSASRVADELGVSESFLERMPQGSVVHRDSPGLSALDEGVLAHVLREDVPANQAARVGDRILEGRELTPDEQLELIRVLDEQQPANLEEADELVDESIEALTREDVRTLFGDENRPRVVFEERNQILDRAMTRIENENPELLERLVDTQQRLNNAGDASQQVNNVDIIENPQQAAEVLRNLARQKGELSDALTDSAINLRETGNLGESVDGFVDETRAAINRGVVDQQITQRGRTEATPDRIRERRNQAEAVEESARAVEQRVENIEETVDQRVESFRDTVQRLGEDMDEQLEGGLRSVLRTRDPDIEDMEVKLSEEEGYMTVREMLDELDEDSRFIRSVRDCL